LSYPCSFSASQKQLEEASQEVGNLETRHDEAQEEIRRTKAGRETAIQEALAKRREIKDLQVSVAARMMQVTNSAPEYRILNER